MTYGATDEFGWDAVENRVHVHDLHATILHLLGLDHERLTYRFAGRDYRLTDVYGESWRVSWHRLLATANEVRRSPSDANDPNSVSRSLNEQSPSKDDIDSLFTVLVGNFVASGKESGDDELVVGLGLVAGNPRHS